MYPAKYLPKDPTPSNPKPPLKNQVGVNGRSNGRIKTRKHQEIIEDV
jgi:hypothetical protein